MRDVPGGRHLLNVFVSGNGEPPFLLHLQPIDRDPKKTMIVIYCKNLLDDDLTQFKNLRLLSLTTMNLTCFNLSLVANYPNLRTLILDHNPIGNLINDAQITLENLSLRNTSLRMIPDATLEITKHLKLLYVSGYYLKASPKDVCSKFVSLKEFNGEHCNRAMDRIPPMEFLQQRSDKDSSGHQWNPVSCVLYLLPILIVSNNL